MLLNSEILCCCAIIGVALIASTKAKPTVNLAAAKLTEMVDRVRGEEMKALIGRFDEAKNKFQEVALWADYGKRAENRLSSEKYLKALKAMNDALETVRAVTEDALPQLLQFLVKEGYRCIEEGFGFEQYAYMCHTNSRGKPLLGSSATFDSCMKPSAKTAEEKALLELFKAKLFVKGGFCAIPGPTIVNRANPVLRVAFTRSSDDYKKSLEKIKMQYPDDARLAAIAPESREAVVAGFLVDRVFDNYGLTSL